MIIIGGEKKELSFQPSYNGQSLDSFLLLSSEDHNDAFPPALRNLAFLSTSWEIEELY